MIGHGALAEKALAPVLPKSTLLSIEDAIDFVNYGKNREAAMDELRDCIREQDEKGVERKMKRKEEVKAATKAHKRKMAQKKKKSESLLGKQKNVLGFGDESDGGSNELDIAIKKIDDKYEDERFRSRQAFLQKNAEIRNKLSIEFPDDWICDHFPYTIRLTSEITASDGSSSMATVCGGSIALRNAGVKLKAPVAGLSIGLVTPITSIQNEWDERTKYKLLCDILGFEDHFTDMDFKIAGSSNGITAIQLDMKRSGVPVSVLCEALDLGSNKIQEIINRLETACPLPPAF